MTPPGRERSPIPSPGRLGLLRPDAAELLGELGWDDEDSVPLLWSLSRSPDPDLALTTLVRLRETEREAGGLAELDTELTRSAALRGRLLGLVGSSTALGDHLVAVAGRWRALTGELPDTASVFRALLGEVGATPEREPGAADGDADGDGDGGGDAPDEPGVLRGSPELDGPGMYRAELTGGAAIAALRECYRDQICLLAAHDLAATVEDQPVVDYSEVSRRLADLADAALTAALAVAVATVGQSEPLAGHLGVIAMGKCGARELNYLSDVDVVFVADPADTTTARVAGEMMRIGSLAFFEVDAALRPEGKSGDLVRTLDSHQAYYRRWAKTWEFQALLKARPMTGDLALAREYHDALVPMVWTASQREDFVVDVQAMRRRVEENVPKALRERELKLGRGGLRDVEFAVQLLQMVHGRTDESLRVTATIEALAALRAGGYVGREDGANLIASYEFLRLLEHRLQLQRYKRTHLLPEDDDVEGYRWLARAAHVRPDGQRDAAEMLAEELRKVRGRVRRLHEKLFYRPLLDSIAGLDDEALELDQQAMERQLAALGFAAPRNAVGHLRALAGQANRRGRIQALLLPALLEWLADTPDPDAGLLNYRRLCEEHQELTWFLRVLRDDGIVARRLMTVLGSSAYVADLLQRAPEVIQYLGDGTDGPLLLDRGAADVAAALVSTAARKRTPDAVIAAARSLRRAELARIGAADVLGMVDLPEVCHRLSSLWTAVLEAALQAVIRATAGAEGPPARIAVIGMGRLGGHELGYGSDADVLLVCEPVAGADEDAAVRWATTVAEKVRTLVSTPTADPPLEIDIDLRPEGRRGPLVRTLGSYRAYYSRWAEVWELQALLRASFSAGDRELGLDFLHMIDEYRYPEQGVPLTTVQQIRRMKARVDAERLPRGADPSTHTKLGRGGLADVEWTAQLLTMQHAARVPGLHTTSTLEALEAASASELLSAGDRTALEDSWTLAGRTRNALVLVRGKPTDQLPAHGKVLMAVAQIMGWEDEPAEFLNHYLKVTRHGRKAVDHVFWGE